MNAEIPQDLVVPIGDLERQAYSLLRQGKYSLAERIYRLIDNTLRERQRSENRRIHKGAPLHMIGLSLLLQRDLEQALRFFILAYIEDTLNVAINHEDEADGYPAGRTLHSGYQVDDSDLKILKDIAREKKTSGKIIFDPETILKEFLSQRKIEEDELLTLCKTQPDVKEVERVLIVYMTPEAKRAIDQIVAETGQKILRKAAEIAKMKGHPDEVREEDVAEAIKKLEGEG